MPNRSIKQPHNISQQMSLHTRRTAKLCDRLLHLTRFPTLERAKKNLTTTFSKERRPTSSPKELGWVVWNGLLTQAVFAGPGSRGHVSLCSVQIALPPIRNRFAAYSPRNSAPKQNLSRQLLELQTIRTMATVCCVSSNAMQLDPQTFGLILI